MTRIPSRTEAARLGQEALLISQQGAYVAPSGARVEVAAALERSMAGTRSWAPSMAVPPSPERRFERTTVAVENDDCLSVARRFVEAGRSTAVLNFASARNPGGGFLKGARAQEEAICRASGLYVCIEGDGMYAHHGAHRDPLYSSWVIHTPAVPVFRGPDDALLEAPWCVDVLTSPAPNAKVALERDPSRQAELERVFAERVERVFRVAAHHGDEALVLGAWGCGAFGNEPAMVARLFGEALERWRGAFSHVTFAVLDGSPERRFITPFRTLARG
ncbi:MAG: TIGR02452 family protein [Myxococcaceae bacterium]|nr:TIGR02452 family protein [Myxococcaceae bacterium]